MKSADNSFDKHRLGRRPDGGMIGHARPAAASTQFPDFGARTFRLDGLFVVIMISPVRRRFRAGFFVDKSKWTEEPSCSKGSPGLPYKCDGRARLSENRPRASFQRRARSFCSSGHVYSFRRKLRAADASGLGFIFVAAMRGKGNPLRSMRTFCKMLFLLRKNRISFSIIFIRTNRIKGLSDKDLGV